MIFKFDLILKLTSQNRNCSSQIWSGDMKFICKAEKQQHVHMWHPPESSKAWTSLLNDTTESQCCNLNRYVPAHLPHLTKSTVPRHRADGPNTCRYANLMVARVRRSTTRATSSRPNFSRMLLVDEPPDDEVDSPAEEDMVTCAVVVASAAEKIRSAVEKNHTFPVRCDPSRQSTSVRTGIAWTSSRYGKRERLLRILVTLLKY